MPPPLGAKQLRWCAPARSGASSHDLRPDVVMERYYNFGGEGIMRRRGRRHGGPRGERAGHRLSRVRPRRCSTARSSSSRCAGGASASARAPTSSSRRAPRSFRGTRRRGRSCELEWGADTERFSPDAPGATPFERPAATVAIFAGAFRSWHGAIHLVRAIRAAARPRPLTTSARCSSATAPNCRASGMKPPDLANVVFTGAVPHARHAREPGGRRHRRGAVRHRRASAALARLLLVAAQDFRVHGGRAARGRARRRSDPVARRPTAARASLYDPAQPDALADALETLADPAVRRTLGRAARERAVREYSWRAHCLALDNAID